MKTLLPLLLLALLTGCETKKPVTRFIDKDAAAHIRCLRLDISPPNPAWRKRLEGLYPFDPACRTTLRITTKDAIVCNSNQNAPRKALTAFPDSYLRMELEDRMHPVYSYYIDLQEGVTEEDIERGWQRVRADLKLGDFRQKQ